MKTHTWHWISYQIKSLWWRHKGIIGSQVSGLSTVCSKACSNWHQRTSEPALCEGNPSVTGGFPSQRASDEASLTTPWCHHNFRSLPSRVLYHCYIVSKPTPATEYGIKHDDVIKWKYFPRYRPFVRGIRRSPVDSHQKGQWCGALKFSLICAWTNGWANNRDAGDLRGQRAHFDVTLLMCPVNC